MNKPGSKPRGATRAKVRDLLAEGLGQNEIARRLGVARSTVAYHCRSLGRAPDAAFGRRDDWTEVQRHYDAGNSAHACRARFGFLRTAWYDAIERGDLSVRPAAMPIEELLRGNRGRAYVKLRLRREGLLPDRCATCGIDTWLGEPLSLCLHHLNGVNDDNRLENLTLLCPNCHSQTDNFSGRNRGAGAAGVVSQETARPTA